MFHVTVNSVAFSFWAGGSGARIRADRGGCRSEEIERSSWREIASAYNVAGFRQMHREDRLPDLSLVAVGGALGIIGTAIGQFINGRRQDQQWRFENKKFEYRELLSAMAKAVRLMILTRGGVKNGVAVEEVDAADEAQSDVYRLIEDRIFIADFARRSELYFKWMDALASLDGQGPQVFFGHYSKMRAAILDEAFKDLGIKVNSRNAK
jgi:hypothetical protein